MVEVSSTADLWQSRIDAAAQTLGVKIDATQAGQLTSYLALLQRWNRIYNLTAVRDPDEMLTHHLFDSLAIVPPLLRYWEALRNVSDTSTRAKLPRLLDVGSGAGLPGVVVAVCVPGASVMCIDTVAKKAAFVQQAAVELRLRNLRSLHGRVETLDQAEQQPFDVICSRAFASLADFTALSAGVLAPAGCWVAMKARHPTEELGNLPDDIQVFHVEQLTVPSLDAERCLIWMRKIASAAPGSSRAEAGA